MQYKGAGAEAAKGSRKNTGVFSMCASERAPRERNTSGCCKGRWGRRHLCGSAKRLMWNHVTISFCIIKMVNLKRLAVPRAKRPSPAVLT